MVREGQELTCRQQELEMCLEKEQDSQDVKVLHALFNEEVMERRRDQAKQSWHQDLRRSWIGSIRGAPCNCASNSSSQPGGG